LARTEGARRQREAEEIAKQEAKDAAMRRANALGEDRQKADQELTKAASDFAKALAAVQAIATRQAQALYAVNQVEAWREVAPSPAQLQGILDAACGEAGAPTGWVGWR
jgi:hypothetical protein